MTRPQKYSDEEIQAAIEETNGHIGLAAQKLGCAPLTIFRRFHVNPELKKIADDHRKIMINVAEHKLFEQIQQGNLTAIIFYLKTRGDYRERKDVDMNVNVKLYKSVSPDDWDDEFMIEGETTELLEAGDDYDDDDTDL